MTMLTIIIAAIVLRFGVPGTTGMFS